MRGSWFPNRFLTRRQLVEPGRMDLAEAILERRGRLPLGWDVDGKDSANADPRCVEADNGAVLSESARVMAMVIGWSVCRIRRLNSLVTGQGSHDSTSIYINGHLRDNMSQQMISSKMDVSKNPLLPGLSWRTRTSERLGSLDSEFEAAEIDFNVNHQQDHEMQKFRLETSEPSDRGEEAEISDGLITHNELKSRLRHLQLQLSSVFALLRSKSEASEIQQEPTNYSDCLQKHYDAWEFQENEIMDTKDMLHSISAKLSGLEGKMALATSDAEKIVERKQKQIDAAHRALQRLRTTCVAWPNHANEVLLAGSFDGWTSQRRMERSSAVIFSLYLKLHPERHEIKFVVDGVWKIDPLRPIVDNNGQENNLLIIT